MLRISVTGESYDRFLNLCANHGIALWNLEYHGNAYEMDISVQGFRMLRPLVKKSRTRVRIIRRQGLPFFLYRCRKKKMLFAGLLCGILLLYFMSCFLWRIDIEGNQQITRGQICRYLETVHIENGTRISVIDCKELAAMLRKQFDAFTWVSVKQEGTRLLIQVKESTDPEANVENNEKKETEGTNPANLPTDLIADKNGVITSMITRKGVPMVSVGDTVKKGDLLVKGELEILDDSGEVSGYQYCASDADIFLKTSYEYREKIRLKRKEKHYSGCSWFAYKAPVDTVSLNQYLTLKFAPVKILLGTWAMLSDFVIDSLEVSPCFGIYIERLHTFTFLKTLGLRAPPVA